MQSFHDRLKAEQDILETYDVEESCKYITVRGTYCQGVSDAVCTCRQPPKQACVAQPAAESHLRVRGWSDTWHMVLWSVLPMGLAAGVAWSSACV